MPSSLRLRLRRRLPWSFPRMINKKRGMMTTSTIGTNSNNSNWNSAILLFLSTSQQSSTGVAAAAAAAAAWSSSCRNEHFRRHQRRRGWLPQQGPAAAWVAVGKYKYDHYLDSGAMWSQSKQWRSLSSTAVADVSYEEPFIMELSNDSDHNNDNNSNSNNDNISDNTDQSLQSSSSPTTTTDTTTLPQQQQQQLFQITADFPPAGDQPAAIAQLTHQLLQSRDKYSVLRGITGTGKTLVMSHIICNTNRPTLVLCHNKTLATQLARELRAYLQNNVVELFVSFYNHYRPEFYKVTTNTYIAKKSSINSDLDTLRHRATRALLTRRDVVIVASVSCIYGLGLPKEYLDASTEFIVHSVVSWDELLERIQSMLYIECCILDNDHKFDRGQYQITESWVNPSSGATTTTAMPVKAKTLTMWPPHDQFPMQIELHQATAVLPDQQNHDNNNNNDDLWYVIHAIREGNSQGFTSVSSVRLFPARHHVVSGDRLEEACLSIEAELRERVQELVQQNKQDVAIRLQGRVVNDVQMIRETGFCKGIENYSRHFSGRAPGEAPDTLLDYFQLFNNGQEERRSRDEQDWLLIVDESHVTLPQLRCMYTADRSRKSALIEHGFRLPSALDNRPLRNEEFWDRVGQTVFVSATPSKTELDLAENEPIDMVIRPTFVCDPEIEVRPSMDQLNDLLIEIKRRALINERTLALTLTKRDSEDLASFLQENGVNSTYLHSGLSTVERSDALRLLQKGKIDCLVGVNCLREGIDLPQVSLVAVLNADSEGFLRSDTALLQVVGRAARNINGKAIFYANRITESMRKCMDSTKDRRQRQLEFNEKHNCQMRSTKGSSAMSFFDLLQDEIQAERPLEIVGIVSAASSTDSGLPSPQSFEIAATQAVNSLTVSTTNVETDHIPTSSGVYFWKDKAGENLYIGKAANLRGRVRSYIASSAKHGKRIQAMLQRAVTVDIMITPSERDALVLESKLIKHHQPRYNVLLKDDEHYPYLCASVGDRIPRLTIVPYRQDTTAGTQRHRYFGPYTNFREINSVLDTIEEKYGLRANAFLARHGSLPPEEYQQLFDTMLKEVFGGGQQADTLDTLRGIRDMYEEAAILFESEHNQSRDIVTILPADESSETEAIVSVLQLREGLVAGHFCYKLTVPFGLHCDQDYASAAMTVLSDRHYPAGEETLSGGFSWFPKAVLMSHTPHETKSVKEVIRRCRERVEPDAKGAISVTGAASRGPKKVVDARALEFAFQNAKQRIQEQQRGASGLLGTFLDGRAAEALAKLLELDKPPCRIECYDISHTQGEFAVGSRVVFENGCPARHLYRSFNVKKVEGVDDYASLQEVLERRFKRVWVKGMGGALVDPSNPWSLPDLVVVDGGKGQLSAAVEALSKASIVPTNTNVEIVNGKGHTASVALCAIAKNEEQIFVHGKKDPVNDGPDLPAVLLLRALRDESHRFALNAHRRRRSLIASPKN